MDSFELNKIFGALLGVLIFAMGLGFVAAALYGPRETVAAGYIINVPEVAAGGDAGPAEVAPIEVRLAQADVANGEAAHGACISCHKFEKGGRNGTGPALWGVVGNVKASHEGFDYSDALDARREAGEKWGFAELDAFLASPRAYTPGTSMGYSGMPDPQRRADLIAWLTAQDDAPEPMPAPPAAEAAPAEGQPAEGQPAEPAPAQ
jgi:cytochrome c